MPKYAMTLSYDGADYAGWQVQPGKKTIQQVVQQTLEKLTGEKTPVIGSGRTDAGVHAAGQVAHFSLHSPCVLSRLQEDLNRSLPAAIRIVHLAVAPPAFHARFSAVKKTYRYSLDLSPIQSPLLERFCMHYQAPMDRSLLEKALLFFIGTKDFTSFVNQATSGAAAKSPIKTIHTAHCAFSNSIVRITFKGNGFLYKMVRNLVATALAVARGELTLNGLAELFTAKNRSLAPPPVPAKGLCLVSVNY